MNVLSLFTGVGGLDLGLEQAGMSTVGQVEINPYCRRVLARHWPEVPKHDDVRTTPEWWASTVRPAVDLVAGGFPCQPFSSAGHRRGTGDQRWGWPWMREVIHAVHPRYVLVENVAALLRDSEAFSIILSDLSELGFDAQWSVVSACSLGAPHTRERLFVLAHPHGEHGPSRLGSGDRQPLSGIHQTARAWRDRVHRSVATARGDDRELDGTAARLVAMGGNAVVPAVAGFVGRLITNHHHTAGRETAA